MDLCKVYFVFENILNKNVCVLYFWQKNDFYVLVVQLVFIFMFLLFLRLGYLDKGKKGNLNEVIIFLQECR